MLKKRSRVSSQQQQPPVARKAKDAGSGGSAPVTVHAADTNAAPAESEKSAQTELGCETHESCEKKHKNQKLSKSKNHPLLFIIIDS